MATTAATENACSKAVAVDPATIEAFETLNKWKQRANNDDAANKTSLTRWVYQHNRTQAANKGFPSVLQVGLDGGLSEHEIAALYGWTTGDYRLVNPIARGHDVATFTEYPFLREGDMSQVQFVLDKSDVWPYVQLLQSALSKIKEPPPRCVWRGIKRDLLKSSSSTSVGSTVGDTLTLPGFTSTTMDRDNALEFCTKPDTASSNSTPMKRTLLCILKPQSGTCISRLSARPQEMEVLFPPNCQFQIADPERVHTKQEDQAAVDEAVMKLQTTIPNATIGLVYVKEIT